MQPQVPQDAPPPQPTPGAAYQPVPPSGAPKKGLSTGALIAIIAGGVLLLGGIITVIIAVLLFANSAQKQASTSPSSNSAATSTDTGSSSAMSPTTAYTNSYISFSYPTLLERKDTSNVTTIYTDGSSPSDKAVFLSADTSNGTSLGMINYAMQPGAADKIDHAKRVAAMKQGVEAQKNASTEQVLAMRASAAHGCAKDFVYTEQPSLVERGEIVGMVYQYNCTSYYGAVHGIYYVWYDEYAGKHSLTIDGEANYWNSHKADLEAIVKSVKLL